jgi:hypothetical protein
MFICICVCMCSCVCVCVCVYVFVCVCVCVCMFCMYVRMYVHVCMNICYVCTYVSIYVWLYKPSFLPFLYSNQNKQPAIIYCIKQMIVISHYIHIHVWFVAGTVKNILCCLLRNVPIGCILLAILCERPNWRICFVSEYIFVDAVN